MVVDRKFYRPSEIYELKGDAGKTKEKLGWKPSVSFEDMITLMVDEDLRSLGVIGR